MLKWLMAPVLPTVDKAAWLIEQISDFKINF